MAYKESIKKIIESNRLCAQRKEALNDTLPDRITEKQNLVTIRSPC